MRVKKGNKRVLAIDDNAADLTIINEVLSASYIVYAVNSGEALDFLKKQRPDLILLGVEMPGVSGLGLFMTIKSDPGLSDIPVIFLAANNEIKYEAEAFRLGAADYMRKPINDVILTARVSIHLEAKHEEVKNRLESIVNTAQAAYILTLDSIPIPIRIVDLADAGIVYVNSSLLELLGYDSADELCGRRIEDILPEFTSDGTDASEIVDMIMSAENPISFETEYLTKAGGTVEAMEVTRLIDFNGRRSSIGIIKDLSAERERAQLLLNAMEREKEANQSKSLFLANMSHEIRTPMNGIIGMTDLLLGEQLKGRQLQYVKEIKASAESLLGIINDILDLSKITEGKLQILPLDVDLCALLKNVVSMMSFAARSKRLEFIDDIQIQSPEYVRVDDVRLKQIITNLLSNAIKFTKEGYVRFTAEIKDGLIRFEVSDTGIGIKKEDIALIFTAFEQVDIQKNRTIKGTGLGLSITKNLVELMNGEIWVESEYGAGTSFFVTIPHVIGDESAIETPNDFFEYLLAPTAQILLVDDIQTNLTVGAGLLRMCGITADVAMSGKEAIELIKSKDYDIVFMDHMMPEMDGIEATRLIRAMGGKYEELCIIALTANAVKESRDLLINSGMDDFLSKPIDKNALMGILEKWLPADKLGLGTNPAEDEKKAVAHSEVLAAVSEIEGLNIELALSRIGGLCDVLETSVKQVAFSVEGQLKRMDAFLANEDMRGFAAEAHGLKGALATIGATPFSELAAELEIAAKAGNRLLCLERFSVFGDEVASFAGRLKKVFAQQEAENKPHGDLAFLKQKAAEAADFLAAFEAGGAMELMDELNSYTFGEALDASLNTARGLTEIFSYYKAMEIMRKIAND